MPEIQDTTLKLPTINKEVRNILEVFDKVIAEINSQRKIFTQDNEIDPAELARGGGQPRPKPPYTMSIHSFSSPNLPLNIHPR